MEAKRFIWLAAASYPRRGPALIQSAEYAVADFDEAVVAQWVAQGAARYIPEKKEKGGGEK